MTDQLPVNALDPAGATNAQVPTYNATTGVVQWADPPAGGGAVVSVGAGIGISVDDTDPSNPVVSADLSIDGLTDVDTTTSPPSHEDRLAWDQAQGKWVPSAASATQASGTFRGTWSTGVDTVVLTHEFDGGTLSPYTSTSNVAIENYAAVAGSGIPSPPAKRVLIGNGNNFTTYRLMLGMTALGAYTIHKVRFWFASDCSTAGYLRLMVDGVEKARRSGHGGANGQWTQVTQSVINAANVSWDYYTDYPAEAPNAGYVARIEWLQTVNVTYAVNDMVLHAGALYACATAGTTETPGAGSDWIRLTDPMV